MCPSQRDVACPAVTLEHFWWRWVVHSHPDPSCPPPSATLRPFPQATSPLGYSAFLDSLLLTSPPPRSFSLPCFTFSFLGHFPHPPLHFCPSGTPLVLSHYSTPILMLRVGGWGFHQNHIKAREQYRKQLFSSQHDPLLSFFPCTNCCDVFLC